MIKKKIIIESYIPLLKNKNDPLSIETECLYGEEFTVLKKSEDWCYGYLNHDYYYGWVQRVNLANAPTANFYVLAPNTFVLNEPNIKSLTINHLSIGSEVFVNKFYNDWAEIFFIKNEISLIGYVPRAHLIKIGSNKLDWVTIAESLIGTPYKWGGKTSRGIDCSALVQISLKLSYIKSPRNSEDQKIKLGKNVLSSNELDLQNLFKIWDANIKRGDLIFWKGHVAIINKPLTLIHANTDTYNVSQQNTKDILETYNKKNLIPLAIKRII